MAYDGTCELLAGATIQGAKRDGIWLVLNLTDKDGRSHELHLSGRTTKGQAYCGKCGRDDRMVEIVRDKGMPPKGYCNQCGHQWEFVA